MSGRGWVTHRRRPDSAPDVGLQAERTAMAWQRTALGVGGVSALLLHHAGGQVAAAAPGIVGLLAALVLLVLTERRYVLTVRRVEAGESPARHGLIRFAAGTVVALAICAVLMVLLVS